MELKICDPTLIGIHLSMHYPSRPIESLDVFVETPCQAFKVVPHMVVATKISSDTSKADEVVPRMVSLKDACVMVEDGRCIVSG